MVKATSAGEEIRCSGDESGADCVAGTLDPNRFLSMLSKAGFDDVELDGFTEYQTAVSTRGALFRAVKPI